MGERKNRRGYDRVAVRLQVEVQAGEQSLVGLVTGNLSMGGILLQTEAELLRETACRLRIPAGAGEVLVEARVVRVYPGALAFRFDRFLGPDSFDRLRRLVVEHTPDPI